MTFDTLDRIGHAIWVGALLLVVAYYLWWNACQPIYYQHGDFSWAMRCR